MTPGPGGWQGVGMSEASAQHAASTPGTGADRPDPAGTVVVLATAFAASGRLEEVLEVVRVEVPTVHREEGCPTDAVHTAVAVPVGTPSQGVF